MSTIKDILKEATDGALNEEVLGEIEKVFESKVDSKVQIHVEQALNEQDELYSSKLEQLIEKIDADHSAKLTQVVEAIDADRANKLQMVIEKYENALNEDAENFKSTLVENISDYIEVYIDEKVPVESIQEAVKNTKARKILEGLRNHLAVDSALEKDAIKSAVVDGKNQINEANTKLESVVNEKAELQKELEVTKANYLLEQKTAKLDERSRNYLLKAMKDKDLEYIQENFDYTLKLFKKKEDDRLESLKEEAYSETPKVDRVVYESTKEPINENAQQLSPYMNELSKY
jgi:hypothetical protein